MLVAYSVDTSQFSRLTDRNPTSPSFSAAHSMLLSSRTLSASLPMSLVRAVYMSAPTSSQAEAKLRRKSNAEMYESNGDSGMMVAAAMAAAAAETTKLESTGERKRLQTNNNVAEDTIAVCIAKFA